MSRRASHAGSWYSSSGSKLDEQLTSWLSAVSIDPPHLPELPIRNCKAIIAPHAGYSYSGPPAAWAYKCVDTKEIDRVFILGPSHHVYLDGCALSRCATYATPLGELELDAETIAELGRTGKFERMTSSVDEDEHSIEMHLPYVRKIFEGRKDVKIVPILVGSISVSKEKMYGALLGPYMIDPRTLFVISSDFCHWGTRFQYTHYLPPLTDGNPLEGGYSLSRTSPGPDSAQPIHQSIRQLDEYGMNTIAFESQQGKTAGDAHDQFSAYLKTTKNTICGRHPIGVLLAAMARLELDGAAGWDRARLQWVRYEQSSECLTLKDSSVSYASAYVCLEPAE